VLRAPAASGTGEKQYLDWGDPHVTWLDVLYDEATGVYHDNIKADGTIEPTKWTYNAGTRSTPSPCSLAETGDDAWLARARSGR